MACQAARAKTCSTVAWAQTAWRVVKTTTPIWLTTLATGGGNRHPAGGAKLGLGLDLGKIGDSVKASISFVLPNFVENLTLVALAGKLSGKGNALDNVLVGNESNNSFNGAGGNDTIDGDAGVDTAGFSSLATNYAITRLDAGWMVASGDVQEATLANIERLQFSASKLALDLSPAERGGQTLIHRAVGPQRAQQSSGHWRYLGHF